MLGPMLWIILFDSFLMMGLLVDCCFLLYGQWPFVSSGEHEDRVKRACNNVFRWHEENRLKLSVGKTKA